MFFDSLQSLIHMDGHGVYVWASYGVGVLVIAGLFCATYFKQQRLRKQL